MLSFIRADCLGLFVGMTTFEGTARRDSRMMLMRDLDGAMDQDGWSMKSSMGIFHVICSWELRWLKIMVSALRAPALGRDSAGGLPRSMIARPSLTSDTKIGRASCRIIMVN